ncbi:S41 family peptidase [Pedobacter hartonius]|uniref:Peptidase family S41 n=1 Tax=Pedobacter hartonius TaxID=425514 RepID=A0A1H3WAD4_9SPHI|nr:S41 family peptidase [Pedobacter hartonius]SDZ83374.1 Peptidase family S41 [Pedobacter hartonius]
MKKSSQVIGVLSAVIMMCFGTGCRKTGDQPDDIAGSYENINSWVLDSMKVYYYWNSSLPDYINRSGDPSAFFKIIKHPSDRFSVLVNPDLPGTYPPSLVHTLGFDLITFQHADGTVETMVTLVVPGSGAEVQGLLRGDIVETINGTQPTVANIISLTDKVIGNQAAELEIKGRTGKVTLSRLSSSEAPVYTYKTFQSAGKTYGYLFLNSFEDAAVNELTQAFSYFKQQQVQELLLDLRYNPGGSVSVAAALAAMIAPAATEGDIFVEYRGNAKAGIRKSSFSAELAKLPSSIRKGFSQFSAYRLGINRVYILSGGHTASAAELTINALKPYITVIQLGKQSLGKDMASFVIKDYRNPQLVPKWEIYPIVFKLYNSAGKGDYSNGLVPDQVVDELSALPLKPFGDLADPLIRRCLALPSAGAIAGLKDRPEGSLPVILFDSRDREDLRPAGIIVARRQ